MVPPGRSPVQLSSGRQFTPIEAHQRKPLPIFARGHAGVTLEQIPEEADVPISDFRADRLDRGRAVLQ